MKILIIGGGAGGMMAALSAAEDANNRVILLERQARLGHKLLATGNGRCNLSNRRLCVENYHGAYPEFVRPALEAFGPEDTLAFFEQRGLLTVTEPSGRVYPLSDQANSVVDTLRFALEQAGVEVVTGCDVVEVRKKARGYEAKDAAEHKYFGDKLIIACGGCAGKKLGGVHAGYRLLQMLGHSCTGLYPSLTQIQTEPALVRPLKGVRADARLRLRQNGKTLAQDEGELQFTQFGVSGPLAFSLSRAAAVSDGTLTLLADFLRAYSRDEVMALLRNKQKALPGLPCGDFLSGTVQSRLGRVIVQRCGLELSAPSGSLGEDELGAIAAMLQYFELPVQGVLGFDYAQVTAGGVRTEEFDPKTLQSRLAPNVFAVGEVLDIDGDCGGYNLQWAWSSGRLAGKSVTREAKP